MIGHLVGQVLAGCALGSIFLLPLVEHRRARNERIERARRYPITDPRIRRR